MQQPDTLTRLHAHIEAAQWGDRDRDPDGYCPSCARSETGHGGRHSYGCDIREALNLIADLEARRACRPTS